MGLNGLWIGLLILMLIHVDGIIQYWIVARSMTFNDFIIDGYRHLDIDQFFLGKGNQCCLKPVSQLTVFLNSAETQMDLIESHDFCNRRWLSIWRIWLLISFFQRGYSGAINACSLGGEWHLAVEVLMKMSEARIQQDAISYNSVITACVHGLVVQTDLGIHMGMG